MTDAVITIALMGFLLFSYMFFLHYLCWVWVYRWITPDGVWIELASEPMPPMPWYDLFSNFYRRE
jgi:hypothetical protein